MNIAIWGTGDFANKIYEGACANYNVVCMVDSDEKKQKKMFHATPVISPDVLWNTEETKVEIEGIIIGFISLHEIQKVTLHLHQTAPSGKYCGLFRNAIYFPNGDWSNFQWYPLGLKIISPYLECNIIDNCNLNCKGCTHFSNLFTDSSEYDLKRFESDISKLSKHMQFSMIRLLGGEPFLSPNLTAYISICRRYYPESNLYVVTNGLLIPRIDQCTIYDIKKNNICIYISEYPPTLSIREEIENKLIELNIDYLFSPPVSNFLRFLTPGKFNRKDISHKNCFHRTCTILRNGRIFNCPTEALLYKYGEFYNIEATKNTNGLSVHEIQDWSMAAKRLYSPIDTCQYCSESGGEIFPWQTAPHPSAEDWLSIPALSYNT